MISFSKRTANAINKDLGDEDGKIAILMLSLALDVLDQFKDLSAEDQGIIYGKIVAELGVIVVGTALSGGASNAAKSGKLAAIANKLKALENAGDLSDTLKKIVGSVELIERMKVVKFLQEKVILLSTFQKLTLTVSKTQTLE